MRKNRTHGSEGGEGETGCPITRHPGQWSEAERAPGSSIKLILFIFFDSPDHGKLLENIVFRHLRAFREDLYFLRNGWECDFVVFSHGSPNLFVQVTSRLDQVNFAREVKGLAAARDNIGNGQAWLLVENVASHLEIPEWIRGAPIEE